LRYRIMYGADVSVPMFDEGAHGAGRAGDGIFSASIPASASTNGQMIRYYICASDVQTNSSRWPLFPHLANTGTYCGTIVHPTTPRAEFIAPSYLRQFLSFWLMDQAAHNSPYHYPVRLQNNALFYQLAYHSEAQSEEQLARFDFDPNGALYKACGVLAVSPCS